jgi:asparagine synthase (glutamine-hydrolysing)
MCGIAAVLGDADPGRIERMTRALHHRGPDSRGFHRNGALQLGMQRLSIIDLESGDQPVYNETGDKCVVFNGEIYNHEELRRQLKHRNHRFRGRSDTEVIIHLYEEYGPRCVEHLRGMFAFAIADGNTLFLARDRLGIKPLYYTSPGPGLLLVASEIKSLLCCADVSVRLDRQTFADATVIEHPVGTRTYFEGIHSMAPGSTMQARLVDGKTEVTVERYYQHVVRPGAAPDLGAAKEQLVARLREAVQTHLAADVEVGLTLSGGLDSTLLAHLMKQLGHEGVRAFTIADGEQHPDVMYASRVAQVLGFRHDVTLLSFEDYLNAIPGVIVAEEQPGCLSGLPVFMLCARIGEQIKVCLNGEGADELFGGYPGHLDPSYRRDYLRSRLPLLKRLGMLPSPEARAWIDQYCSARRFEELLAVELESEQRDQLIRNHFDIVDHYSMAAGLEIRVPYVDQPLVDFVNALPLQYKVNWPVGIGKYILKQVALDLIDRSLYDVVLRQKVGFPSAASLYRARFARLCEERLPEDYLQRHELGFCFGQKYELLVFELFEELCLMRRSAAADGFDVLSFIDERAAARS